MLVIDPRNLTDNRIRGQSLFLPELENGLVVVRVRRHLRGSKNMEKVLFGEPLKNAREASGMSQKMMANRLGVKSSTIGKWESGRDDPRANRLQMIASLLDVPLLWLLAGSQQVPAHGRDQPGEGLLRQKMSDVNAIMKDLQRSVDELGLLVEAKS
jgi:transcriptional regulator with XRE-family HTH domain